MFPADAAGARSALQTNFSSDMPHTEAPPAPAQRLAPGDSHADLPNGCHADVIWHAASNSATVTLTDDRYQKIGTIDLNQNKQTAVVKQYDPLTGKENKSATYTADHGMVFTPSDDVFQSTNMLGTPTDLTLSNDQRFAFRMQSPTGNGAPIDVEIATNIKGWANDGDSKLTGHNNGIGAIVSMPAMPGNERGGDDGLLIGATGSGNSRQMTAEYLTNFQHPGAQDYDGPAATRAPKPAVTPAPAPSHDAHSEGLGYAIGAAASRFLAHFQW